jgi:hypothetical protein
VTIISRRILFFGVDQSFRNNAESKVEEKHWVQQSVQQFDGPHFNHTCRTETAAFHLLDKYLFMVRFTTLSVTQIIPTVE